MSLMQSPETIMLIHRTMIREELERREIERQAPHSYLISRLLMSIRRITGRTLISMGTRLDPERTSAGARPSSGRVAVAR